MFVSVRVNRFLALFLIFCAAVAAVAGFCEASATTMGRPDETAQGIQLPIIMYHSLLKEKKRQGKYVVSPDLFESDLRYLQAKGYHEVYVKDLLDYVEAGVPLPSKPVMLTFDDGYYNNYLYAYPLLKKYDAKIVISPVGYYTNVLSKSDADHANYSYLTWDEINEMMASGLVEFQNHTYNLHADHGRLGVQKLQSETSLKYESLLRADLGRMQMEMTVHTGRAPTAFVYPFGIISKESVPVIKSLGFRASMTCESRVNTITADPECLFGLGRYLRPSGTSSEAFFSRIGIK